MIYDAVIVGGGHNGLVTGIYLAMGNLIQKSGPLQNTDEPLVL